MTSGSPTNPPGCAALIGAVAVRHVGRRIDRQLLLARRRSAGRTRRGRRRVDRIPDRKRHAEEPLPADAPVAVQAVGPVLVARLHVRRMPLQLAAAREQRLAELDRLDEPLAAGDDLERPIALLVELHRVRDRPRLADQIAGLAAAARRSSRAPSPPTAAPARRSAAARDRRRSIPSPARPTSRGAACRRAG